MYNSCKEAEVCLFTFGGLSTFNQFYELHKQPFIRLCHSKSLKLASSLFLTSADQHHHLHKMPQENATRHTHIQ